MENILHLKEYRFYTTKIGFRKEEWGKVILKISFYRFFTKLCLSANKQKQQITDC